MSTAFPTTWTTITFASFYQRYSRPLVDRVALRLRQCGSSLSAEDLVQQFMTRELERAADGVDAVHESFDPARGRFRSFVLTCVTRFALQELRRRENRVVTWAELDPRDERLPPIDEDPLELFCAYGPSILRDCEREVRRLIREDQYLSSARRKLLERCYALLLEGTQSVRGVAKALKISRHMASVLLDPRDGVFHYIRPAFIAQIERTAPRALQSAELPVDEIMIAWRFFLSQWLTYSDEDEDLS